MSSSTGSIKTELQLLTVNILWLRCWHFAHPHLPDVTFRNIDDSSLAYDSHSPTTTNWYTLLILQSCKPWLATQTSYMNLYLNTNEISLNMRRRICDKAHTECLKSRKQPMLHYTQIRRDITEIYRVGQIKEGHKFQLLTSEMPLGSSLFWAESKAI